MSGRLNGQGRGDHRRRQRHRPRHGAALSRGRRARRGGRLQRGERRRRRSSWRRRPATGIGCASFAPTSPQERDVAAAVGARGVALRPPRLRLQQRRRRRRLRADHAPRRRRLGLHLRRARARRLARHEVRRAGDEGAGPGRLLHQHRVGRRPERRRRPAGLLGGEGGGDQPDARGRRRAGARSASASTPSARAASSRRSCTAAAPRRWRVCSPRCSRGPRRASRNTSLPSPLFLASDDARFVTGEALVADGGLMAAGSGAIRTLAQGQSAYAAAGMDQGSTGKEMTFRTIED